MNDYYVYVNWTREYTMIHQADCSFRNDDDDAHGARSGENDEWRGPFATFEQAQTVAATTGYERSLCQRCL